MEEVKKEEKAEIVVIDRGVDANDPQGPESLCCYSAYIPIRG
jgi:hypothetical protein